MTEEKPIAEVPEGVAAVDIQQFIVVDDLIDGVQFVLYNLAPEGAAVGPVGVVEAETGTRYGTLGVFYQQTEGDAAAVPLEAQLKPYIIGRVHEMFGPESEDPVAYMPVPRQVVFSLDIQPSQHELFNQSLASQLMQMTGEFVHYLDALWFLQRTLADQAPEEEGPEGEETDTPAEESQVETPKLLVPGVDF